jgi:hypothetical protein
MKVDREVFVSRRVEQGLQCWSVAALASRLLKDKSIASAARNAVRLNIVCTTWMPPVILGSRAPTGTSTEPPTNETSRAFSSFRSGAKASATPMRQITAQNAMLIVTTAQVGSNTEPSHVHDAGRVATNRRNPRASIEPVKAKAIRARGSGLLSF